METRAMSWDDEGFLANELQWIVDGAGSRPLTTTEQAEAERALELVVAQAHEEPDELTEEEYETLSEDEIERREDEQAMVEMTLPAEVWAVIDRLLAAEGVDFGMQSIGHAA